MQLTPQENAWLRAVGAGIKDTEAFIAELTDYHGGEVRTEYLLTTDIARALLTHCQSDVAVEFLINGIRWYVMIRDIMKRWSLGSRRFDVAVLYNAAPIFVVEVKIRVSSLHPELAKDLKKIIEYLEYLKCPFAGRVLGACVFQVYLPAEDQLDVTGTTQRVHALEARLRNELATFASGRPGYEFAWVEFQPSTGRIHDDEKTIDVDDVTPMLGRPGYACRYHAILVRRLCGATGSDKIEIFPID